jgi:lipid-binding SYLF domain-containing protein
MKNHSNKIASAFFAAIIALCLTFPSFAQNDNKDSKQERKAAETARKAANAFNDIMDKADRAIPRELLERAEAVAIFPGVLKAAFIVGGRGGEGLISRRTPTGWSAPAFFKLGGGSFGAQIGADKTDYVMLFVNDGGIKGLLKDKFEFGGDIGIAAGPIGREASATTTAKLDAGILSYSRSRGAFIGAALKGSVISPDDDRNRAVYGKTAKEILLGDAPTAMPETIMNFPQTLIRYSNRPGKPLNSDLTRERTVPTQGETTAPVVDEPQ